MNQLKVHMKTVCLYENGLNSYVNGWNPYEHDGLHRQLPNLMESYINIGFSLVNPTP